MSGGLPDQVFQIGRITLPAADGLVAATRMAISQLNAAPSRYGSSQGDGGLTWHQCKALAAALQAALDQYEREIQPEPPLSGTKTSD